jgi:hypothetical protein
VIDLSQAPVKSEFIPSNRKYRLMLSPARLQLSNHCTMSMCIEATKIASHCEGTIHYELTVSLLPWKFGPGKFAIEPSLYIDDPKAEFDIEPKLHFQRRVTGEIAMPWLDVKQTAALRTSLQELFAGRISSVNIDVNNIGNRPITLGSWSQEATGTQELVLDGTQCGGMSLPPGQSCSLVLRRSGSEKLTQKIYSWFKSGDNDRYSTMLLLSLSNVGITEIGIQNR